MGRRLIALVLFFMLAFHPVSAAEIMYTIERLTASGVETIGATGFADSAFILAEEAAGQNLSWTPHICIPGDCEVSQPDRAGVVWVITRTEE